MKSIIKILSCLFTIGLITIVVQFSLASSSLLDLYAQDKIVFADSLKVAEANYNSGNWQESIRLINECLSEPNISETEKGEAYRLLGLVYIAQELEKEANDAVKNLLLMVPNYKTDPDRDPPPLTRMIDDISQQLKPVISSITPNSAEAGSEALNLVVKGADFVYGATVQFNGLAKITTYVNQNQLSVEISANDLEKEGEYEVTVFSPIQGGKTSNAVKFTVTSSSSFPWTWVGIGAGAVAAVVVAVIVLGGNGDEPPPPQGTFPEPPPRP